MTNYKLILEYEGTRYNGWQKQGNTENTIQSVIEEAIARTTGEECPLIGSGRTDAGTHSIGQTANFKANMQVNASEMMSRLNSALPSDIRITDCEIVDDRFHSRYNASAKIYTYRIYIGEKQPVFDRRTTLHYPSAPDVAIMKKAAEMLVGEHDFKAFSTNRRTKKSTVRKIYSIDIELENNYLTFTYKGNGFLYNMVRILTGTLLEIGIGKRQPNEITDIFKSGDRSNAGATLPPRGLMLKEVIY